MGGVTLGAGTVGAAAPATSSGNAAEARAVLAHHGRSFHWASRLLAGEDADRCARLYAFCRRVDDWVDEGDPGDAAARLERLRHDIRRGESHDPAVADFLRLAESSGISQALALAFVDGVATDLGRVALHDEAELLRYAYGVASTVGLMMCAVLGVRDPRALPFAIDLGIAMQLTNICRDVAEDAAVGRRYLPETILHPDTRLEGLARGDAAARRDARRAVRLLLAQADRFYRSADEGMRYLPWRARLGILTASRVYEAIGPVVLGQGDEDWGRRAVVGPGRKLLRTARAVGALLLRPRYWRRTPGPPHDAGLHRALRSLPGANPKA